MARLPTRLVLRLGITLLLASTACAAAGSEQAAGLLRRMADASAQLSYDGIFVYMQGAQVQTMRILHSAAADGERERLVSLDGPPREVIRQGGNVVCYLPDDKSFAVENGGVVGPPLPGPVPTDLERLRAHYLVTVGGTQRIAGRMARLVTLAPRDAFRYGHRYWIAEEDGLLLKSELFGGGGEVIERVLFTTIDVRERIPDELLHPGIDAPGRIWKHGVAGHKPLAGDSRWRALTLPPGFKLDFAGRYPLSGSGVAVDHLIYSDGLASVSLFIEKADGAVEGKPGRMGAVNTFVRQEAGHRVTAVGEVPEKTVRLLVGSVRRDGH